MVILILMCFCGNWRTGKYIIIPVNKDSKQIFKKIGEQMEVCRNTSVYFQEPVPQYIFFSVETLTLLQYLRHLLSQQIPSGIAVDIFTDSKAHYTLFANNNETRTKLRKTDVQRMVCSKCSPYFANRFFTNIVRRIFVEVAVSPTNTKEFFVKKNSHCWKLMANNK